MSLLLLFGGAGTTGPLPTMVIGGGVLVTNKAKVATTTVLGNTTKTGKGG